MGNVYEEAAREYVEDHTRHIAESPMMPVAQLCNHCKIPVDLEHTCDGVCLS